jgi:hypothetical protein
MHLKRKARMIGPSMLWPHFTFAAIAAQISTPQP